MAGSTAKMVMVAIAVAANVWCSAALADQKIALDKENSLTITINDKDRTATIAVSQGEDMVQSLTIANASVDASGVVGRRFCKGCEVAYFVPAYDRTSNYGAVTGVVAYNRGAWSGLSILPLSVAGVIGPDASGRSYLTDNIPINHKPHVRRFTFDVDGILRPM